MQLRRCLRFCLSFIMFLVCLTISTLQLQIALIDCASIIFGIIWKNEHNFCTVYKSSTASIIGIFLMFLKGTFPESWLAWSLRLTIFKFCSWFSLFSFVWGRGNTAILRRSSSRGLCTPYVKIASFPVPAFTGSKMASSNLQIREEEQLPDRPEPVQNAKDQNLKQTKSKYKTGGGAFDVKKKSHYMSASISFQVSIYVF